MPLVIDGLQPLIADLIAADKKMGRQTLRQALRDGAKVIQNAIVPLVPVKTGFLQKRIKVRATARKRGQIGIQVRTGEREGLNQGKAFYGGFINWGTKARHRHRKGRGGNRSTGAARGKVVGRHFFEQGFERSQRQAADAVEARIYEGLREQGL